MYDEAEATVFEVNPFGARQRLLPSRTLVERLRAAIPSILEARPVVEVEPAPPPVVPAPPMLFAPASYPVAPRSQRPRRVAIAAFTALALSVAVGALLGRSEASDRERTETAIAIGAGVSAPTKPEPARSSAREPIDAPPEVELDSVAVPSTRRAAPKRARPTVTVDAATPLGQLRPKRW